MILYNITLSCIDPTQINTHKETYYNIYDEIHEVNNVEELKKLMLYIYESNEDENKQWYKDIRNKVTIESKPYITYNNLNSKPFYQLELFYTDYDDCSIPIIRVEAYRITKNEYKLYIHYHKGVNQ